MTRCSSPPLHLWKDSLSGQIKRVIHNFCKRGSPLDKGWLWPACQNRKGAWQWQHCSSDYPPRNRPGHFTRAPGVPVTPPLASFTEATQQQMAQSSIERLMRKSKNNNKNMWSWANICHVWPHMKQVKQNKLQSLICLQPNVRWL